MIGAKKEGEFVEVISGDLVFGEKVDEEETEFVLDSAVVSLFEDRGDVVL